MLISQNIGMLYELRDLKKILNIIKNAGFDAYDYTMFTDHGETDKYVNIFTMDDYVSKAKELREYADSIGLICNQAHAIFPSFFKGDEERTEKGIKDTIKCMEIASILGAKIIVVHPENNCSAKENAEYYKRLEHYCEKYNIIIGVENMWNWDDVNKKVVNAACAYPKDFLETIELLNPKWFTCCVDIGHAEMMSGMSAKELIKTLGSHVGALHIHDNDKYLDRHMIPFSGKINFDEVTDALKEINYKGDVTLEVLNFLNVFPTEEKYYQIGTNIMYEAAKRIYDKINEK